MKLEKKVSIRFPFNIKKFVNAITFFAQKVSKLDKLKAAKLLYFADKHHLIRYGRPIFGDCYHSLDYGPVPSICLDIMNEVLQPLNKIKIRTPNRNTFEQKLKVVRSKDYPYPYFKEKVAPDFRVFSQSETESLKAIISEYGNKSSGELIDLTHKDATWLETEQNSEIDYQLFFKDNPQVKPGASELMETFQEDRDFIKSLRT